MHARSGTEETQIAAPVRAVMLLKVCSKTKRCPRFRIISIISSGRCRHRAIQEIHLSQTRTRLSQTLVDISRTVDSSWNRLELPVWSHRGSLTGEKNPRRFVGGAKWRTAWRFCLSALWTCLLGHAKLLKATSFREASSAHASRGSMMPTAGTKSSDSG